MVKKANNTTVRNGDSTRTSVSDLASPRHSNYTRRNSVDDIIVSLAEAYENKRARQVVEWVRQQNASRAA